MKATLPGWIIEYWMEEHLIWIVLKVFVNQKMLTLADRVEGKILSQWLHSIWVPIMLDCPLDTRVDDGNDPYGGFNEVAPALQTDDLELDEGKN